MTRDLADRVMKARKESTCPLCSGPVRVGQYIARTGTRETRREPEDITEERNRT